MKEKFKIISLYYPQFYSIPLNDLHWEKGFTDWVNVKKSQAQYQGHYQPRIPLNKNYYDQSKPETIKEQVKLAKQYGIDGFCFYHYWFDGKLLLEKPIENFYENKELNIEYCLSWANETWSKRWIGKDSVIMQQQNHLPDKKLWKQHFDYLKQFFKDERYIKIENKPVFIIYQPEIIKDFEKMKEYWNELCLEEGIEGIYFIATKSYEFNNKKFIEKNFDGIFNFQPRQIYNSNLLKKKSLFSNSFFQKFRILPEKILNELTKLRYHLSSFERLDYTYVSKKIIEQELKDLTYETLDVFSGFFVGWDNTPRYGNKSKIYENSTPDNFYKYLKEIVKLNKNKKQRYIIINAWNEWAEGAYLEPDEKYKYQFLEKIEKLKNEE